MRTDPRADEVRSIVERVLSGYFQERRQREAALQGLSPCGSEDLPAGRLGYAGWRSAGRVDIPRMHALRLAGTAEEEIDSVLPEIDESILIDQGRYVARTYRTEGYMAMWLVSVGIVQFYDDGGRMLATIDLFASLRPQRMAA